ncbi:basic salivary proline-rich protein 1-like [Aquila chrysaetos chrysaetos]|uniref:basic salivary proline-rich protein 1-like n=1 Tax=Aquila chrysaetos chrysaetos TaxID=223781 RepID=UPI001B7D3CC0|nr:basic salivary proline-rich protein 1-like [Aquila chrysaetos chrysaetos]
MEQQLQNQSLHAREPSGCHQREAVEKAPKAPAARSQGAGERAVTNSRGGGRRGKRGLARSCCESSRAAGGGGRGRGRRGRVSPHPRAAAAAAAHRACGSLNNSRAHREAEEGGAPPKRGPREACSQRSGKRSRVSGVKTSNFSGPPARPNPPWPGKLSAPTAGGGGVPEGPPSPETAPAAAAAPAPGSPRHCSPPAARQRGPGPPRSAISPASQHGCRRKSAALTPQRARAPPPHRGGGSSRAGCPVPAGRPRLRERLRRRPPAQAAGRRAGPAQRPQQARAPAASPGAEVGGAAAAPEAESWREW